ncbi:MAG: hypothetical protein WA854_18675 [Candidatus Binataceae bacterium]
MIFLFVIPARGCRARNPDLDCDRYGSCGKCDRALMMRIPAVIFPILAILTIALPGNSQASSGGTVSFQRANITYTLFDVSIPNIPMRPGDRIERFDCDILGTVERIRVPYEWKITVDNPTGDHATVRAEANVGAAAFDQDISYFHNFLRIAKMSAPGRHNCHAMDFGHG